MSGDSNRRNIGLTVEIVTAFVRNNSVPVEDLPGLIDEINSALNGLQQPAVAVQSAPEPAVNPKRSITPDFIVCLEDGKKFRSLRRHLGSRHGITPDAYRAKWGLPRDYPMTAPNYTAKRSELARWFTPATEVPNGKAPTRPGPKG